MPELPEVEVTRRSFVAEITGATVQSVSLGQPLRWPLGIDPPQLCGRQVMGLRRRGKYILMDLDQGLLLLHLGMSGSLRFATHMPSAGKHDHFEMVTSQGTLRLHDPRRFGAVVWAANESDAVVTKLLGHLGVEPFSAGFTAEHLWRGLKTRSSAIKMALLQGEIVVGVGNIYACEALFLAGIRPSLPSHQLSRLRAARLHRVILEVLHRAVEAGGSTLKDFSSAAGTNGHYQAEAFVYDRQGLPCHTCATPIRRIVQGQRSTYFCPNCQKR